MTLFYRILNYKFMHILCFDSFGRKYFTIFTRLFIIIFVTTQNLFQDTLKNTENGIRISQ